MLESKFTIEKDDRGRFFCEECTQRYGGPGDCADCEGEPLLDLANEEVRRLIIDFDEARWRRQATKWGLVSLVVTSPLLVVLGLILAHFGVGLAVLCALGLSSYLMSAFPPAKKMPDMSPDEIAALTTEPSPTVRPNTKPGDQREVAREKREEMAVENPETLW